MCVFEVTCHQEKQILFFFWLMDNKIGMLTLFSSENRTKLK